MNRRIALTTIAMMGVLQLAGCGGAVVQTPRAPVAAAPAPAPAPAPIVAEAPPPRIEVDETILFYGNSARVREESLPVIDEVAEQINAQPESIRIRVEGHTAGRRRADYNRRLSQERAEEVVEQLIELGVQPERLEAEGFGFDRPLTDNTTREGRAQNRRVEFIVITDEG